MTSKNKRRNNNDRKRVNNKKNKNKKFTIPNQNNQDTISTIDTAFKNLDLSGESTSNEFENNDKEFLINQEEFEIILDISPIAYIFSPRHKFSNPTVKKCLQPMLDHLSEINKDKADEFKQQFNGEGRLFDYRDKFLEPDDIIDMYYNKKNKRTGHAIYPYSFQELFDYFNELDIYTEVFYLKTSIPKDRENQRLSKLIDFVKHAIPLGKLKPDISIPLNKITMEHGFSLLMIVSVNGMIAISSPFYLHSHKVESEEDHKLKLDEDLPLSLLDLLLFERMLHFGLPIL